MCAILQSFFFFFFQAEDGIRDAQESRGLGDVYKRQVSTQSTGHPTAHTLPREAPALSPPQRLRRHPSALLSSTHTSMEAPKHSELAMPPMTWNDDDSNYSSDEVASPAAEVAELRLMQFNIHGWRDTYHRDNFDAIVEAVQAADPEVLVLNEVLHPYGQTAASPEYLALVKSGKGNGYTPEATVDLKDSYLQRLADATGLRFYAFGAAIHDGYFGRFGYGNAVLSKVRLVDVAHTVVEASSLEYTEERRIEAEDRGLTSATVLTSPPIRVFTTHLDQLDEALRHQQIKIMLSEIKKSTFPAVLVGDLNTYQSSDYDNEGWAAIQEMWAKKNWGDPPRRSATLEQLAADQMHDAHYLCERNLSLIHI
eukprot:TRINITY_DN750_c0_g1_i1.p1 TRINITY_DN750_c0_g1~~TRINITY_DN750_c0_g1_i1.p1  ORF type:complete len:367 (-),score=112.68 TRINITY_DN750_c0_g1_i1:158-1258(-)